MRIARARRRSASSAVAGRLRGGQGEGAGRPVERLGRVVQREGGRGIPEGLLASAQPRQEHRPARQGRGRLRMMRHGPVQDLHRLLGPAERLGEHARLALEGPERFRVELASGAEVLQRPGGVGGQPIQAAHDPAQLVAGDAREPLATVRLGRGLVPPGLVGSGADEEGAGRGVGPLQEAVEVGDRARRVAPLQLRQGAIEEGVGLVGDGLEDAVEIGQRPVEIASVQGDPAAIEIGPGEARPELDPDAEALIGPLVLGEPREAMAADQPGRGIERIEPRRLLGQGERLAIQAPVEVGGDEDEPLVGRCPAGSPRPRRGGGRPRRRARPGGPGRPIGASGRGARRPIRTTPPPRRSAAPPPRSAPRAGPWTISALQVSARAHRPSSSPIPRRSRMRSSSESRDAGGLASHRGSVLAP